ncbi:thiopurine S-methyltransferase [Salinicola aestuarinus]|uniref:thiopurine S-methyltransferase n=1 Tax=Salinicola aestuarinus TaxID=1949082 RepID=UPI000DA1D7A2|nr:thiopurine S-methyltransferase [Salinicola aestuarinus]
MTEIDWLERWRQGRIGFHRETPHPALVAEWPTLRVAEDARVLVPLCGKSPDLRWLAARGHAVTGVELSSLAVEQFVAQSSEPVTRWETDDFACVRQDAVEIWCGDFFHFDLEPTVPFGAFYDRAALIALPAPARQRYALHLAQLIEPGRVGLLITLTHGDPERGPPFSVDAAEVERLLAPNFEVTCLDRGEAADDGVEESVWRLLRRGPRDAG